MVYRRSVLHPDFGFAAAYLEHLTRKHGAETASIHNRLTYAHNLYRTLARCGRRTPPGGAGVVRRPRRIARPRGAAAELAGRGLRGGTDAGGGEGGAAERGAEGGPAGARGVERPRIAVCHAGPGLRPQLWRQSCGRFCSRCAARPGCGMGSGRGGSCAPTPGCASGKCSGTPGRSPRCWASRRGRARSTSSATSPGWSRSGKRWGR